PGDLAFDCGANLGVITGKLAATGCEVIAYEPDPVAFAALEAAHGGAPNVTLNAAAVGVAAGQAVLLRDAAFDSAPEQRTLRSSIIPGGNAMAETAIEVPVVNLLDDIAQHAVRPGGIAFLKLDVEGAELDILTEMLRHDVFAQVRLTVAELHGYKFPDLKPEFQALRSTLTAKYPPHRVWLNWI
ncbi:MAG: FkbM family methyltransferase, partial [Pseudomonadota bacterium]